LSETEEVVLGAVVAAGCCVVCGGVVTDVFWTGGIDWVHPQTITRMAAIARRTKYFFID
jgi:Ni,Fe-hydrogenase III small subunit